MADIYGFSMKTIDGAAQPLADYREKVLPVVNVASKCGLTPQYEAFCTTSYGVTFPMFSKIDVNGPARAPLYTWLTEQATKPDGPGDIKWNFAKFLVDRRGNVVARFDPKTSPAAPDVRQAIERALA